MQSVLLSSDGHVYEPADLWTSRVPKASKDRAPKVEAHADGDWWYCEGRRLRSSPGAASQAGKRFTEPEKLSTSARFTSVLPGSHIPSERLKEMASDGLSGEVLFPTVCMALFRGIEDSALLSTLFTAYNEWLHDYCSYAPAKLKGIGMINVDNIAEGIESVKKASAMGFTGVMPPVFPKVDHPYGLPEYEPLWSTADDLGISMNLHISTNRYDPKAAPPPMQVAADYACADQWVRQSIASMIFAGVFERHPKLKLASVEQELAWIPFLLDRMDYTYTQRVRSLTPYRFKGSALPSDFFHQNVFCGFQEDAEGIRNRHIIGVDNLIWGSDYPHAETTFPRSRETLDRILVGVPEVERAKIVGGNTARVYRFN